MAAWITGTELLAPARDLDAGRVAIDCGADAVYIGAARYGARANAGNRVADIAALAEYAHTYWARVYVTLNTLLHDAELPQAVQLAHDLYDAGVDALIIQDVGLLEMDLPPLPLIASTQMHNHTPERVAFLEHVGFQRVILARELSLAQIQEIRAQTDVELEVFVHGALCVSYSGQCYMSYAIGGRSGNRGECAQPCRRLYSLEDRYGNTLVKERFLLSLRDLNLRAHLGDLLDVGVTSFKIEGRLKDELYVKNVVTAYRRALDAELALRGQARSSAGQSYADFTPNLAKTFNRGYTSHFFHGRRSDAEGFISPGSIDTPKMRGEEVGEVAAVRRRSFTLDRDADLHSGDGLTWFDAGQRLQGTVVNAAQGRRVEPNDMAGIAEGITIYRNRDHAFLRTLEKAPVTREIDVWLTLRATPEGFRLEALDAQGNVAEATLATEKEPAHKAAQMEETARRQLCKTGDTSFRCADVTLDWERVYFLPLSALNQLRREALERLEAVREENRPRPTSEVLVNAVPYPAKRLDYHGNALNRQAVAFYQRHGVEEVGPAAESGLDMRDRPVMRTRYCLKRQLGWCPREGSQAAPADPLYLVDEDGHRYRVRFDCDTCEMEIYY